MKEAKSRIIKNKVIKAKCKNCFESKTKKVKSQKVLQKRKNKMDKTKLFKKYKSESNCIKTQVLKSICVKM